MGKCNINQQLLFKAAIVYHLNLQRKCYSRFWIPQHLKRLYPTTSKYPVGYKALLKALIYRNMKIYDTFPIWQGSEGIILIYPWFLAFILSDYLRWRTFRPF